MRPPGVVQLAFVQVVSCTAIKISIKINIVEFDLSLKLTWVRKTLMCQSEWLHFALENKIDRLVKTGENYHQELHLAIHNPFWKCVVLAYKKWAKTLKTSFPAEIEDEPLWGNPMIKIPFNNALFKSNIIYVKDLFNHDGQPITLQQLRQLTGKNVMFTSYFALWKALLRAWKNQLQYIPKDINVYRPKAIEWLCKNKKGTINIRKIWRPIEPPLLTGKRKWIEELDIDDNENWKDLYLLPIQSKLNARCKYFQVQILHRTLVTNKKLKLFKIKDSDVCDNCAEIENISHLLYDCEMTNTLWNNMCNWLRRITPNTIYMDKKSILLGNPKNEIVINYIITITKHEIYKSKWNKTRLTLLKIKNLVKYQIELEIYLGTIKNNLPKVLGKWAPVLNELRNL